MNDSPLISVILPTHNRAHLLDRAIDSVLSQSWRNLELIVVDDGSTDDTAALLNRLDDSRLSVIHFDSNRGASAARNAGLAQARGEFVTFMDSDDAWYEHRITRQHHLMARAPASVGLSVCSIHYVRPGQEYDMLLPDRLLPGKDAVDSIVMGTGYSTLGWMAPRSVLQNLGGFDEELPRLQDYEFALRIALEHDLLLISDILATAWLQPDSVSSDPTRYTEAIERIVDQHRSLFEQHSKGYSYMIFRAGKYLALEGRRGEAIAWFSRSLRIRPLNVRALTGLLLCATGLFGLFARLKYRRS
jgi:glycosyltransferase involved in cell wall biosynthesis